jgi:hypothetical protein
MVAKYEKLDLTAFKQKLADGEYASLTGARRAVGRMTTWSEADKNKARTLAEKHFGVEASAPKSSPKKAAKKSAKKAPKKAAKAKPVKQAKAPRAPKEKAAKKAVKRVRKGQDAAPNVQGSVMDRITEAGASIKTFGGALDEMSKAKALGAPNEQIREGAKIAQEGLIHAVNSLCRLTGVVSNELAGGNGASNPAWDRAVDATQAPMNAPTSAPMGATSEG